VCVCVYKISPSIQKKEIHTLNSKCIVMKSSTRIREEHGPNIIAKFAKKFMDSDKYVHFHELCIVLLLC